MTYKNQLKDPRWQEKRKEILKRDSSCCVNCDTSMVELHVHHLFYEKNKMAWEYPDTALITLCSKCHKEVHSRLKKINGLLSIGCIKRLKEYNTILGVLSTLDLFNLAILRKLISTMPYINTNKIGGKDGL